ncbi:hypothetical protein ABZ354_14210 [Streptomyces sp. NPDC005925]|uniref:hypothetical protein n=1 Tax=Streptomyces sp. NPDC005925 TaxID=3157172 RepID=UPI0033E7CA3C
MRVVAAAAGLAGAFALTACGDSGDAADKATDSPSASAPADSGGGGDASDGASAGGGLQGSWLATTDGKAVALVINGSEAGLFTTGGSVCSGTAEDRSIRLTCTDGNKDRANGTVGAVNGSTLTVTWEGTLGKETYTRSKGGKMPTGLPTAGLGS